VDERKGSGDPFFQGIAAIAGGVMLIATSASYARSALGSSHDPGMPATVRHVQIETGAHQSKHARVELDCKAADGSARTLYATMSLDESRPYGEGFATRVFVKDEGKPAERVLTTESSANARRDTRWLIGAVGSLGLGFVLIGIVLLRRSHRQFHRR